MSKIVACPDPREFGRLVRGELSQDETEILCTHILSCGSCAQQLNTACADDPLAAALHSGLPRSLVDNPAADALIQRLVDKPPNTELRDTLTGPPPATPGGEVEQAPMPMRLGRYELIGRLATGGMGIVFRGRDTQLLRDVAIKVPIFRGTDDACQAARKRFVRETRAAAAVRHPNVCPIYDVGEELGRPYVVMPLVEGESLSAHLRRQGRFDDPHEAVTLVALIADALAAVHALGIVHRDLKPSNILLDRAGRPLLTDFGLARAEDSEQLTDSSILVGTPAYMAPEQAARALGPVGPAADQYSLAVVLYQMLTGKLPFEGSPLDVVAQVRSQSVPPPTVHRPDLDLALQQILMRALARPIHERYPSVAEFARALSDWNDTGQVANAGPLGDSARRKPNESIPAAPAGKPSHRHRLWWWSVAALLVLSLAIWAATVFRAGVEHGEFSIETDDDRVAAAIDKQGGLVLIDQASQTEYRIPAGKAQQLPAGEYELRVSDPTSGLTFEGPATLSLTREGRKVKVWFEKTGNRDAERRAAEWVVSVGGEVALVGRGYFSKKLKKAVLPEDAFVVYRIDLTSGREAQVTEEGLKNLAGLARLQHLDLSGAGPAVNNSTAIVGTLKTLKYLNVFGCGLTDEGFKPLRKLSSLLYLEIGGNSLSDAVLNDLERLTSLEHLGVSVSTGISWARLLSLKNTSALSSLSLQRSNRLSDADLSLFKDMPRLYALDLAGTRITDKGLATLASLPKLGRLYLSETQITDAGLKYLHSMKTLEHLDVRSCKVTDEGVKKLSAAFPHCQILWDGGTISARP